MAISLLKKCGFFLQRISFRSIQNQFLDDWSLRPKHLHLASCCCYLGIKRGSTREIFHLGWQAKILGSISKIRILSLGQHATSFEGWHVISPCMSEANKANLAKIGNCQRSNGQLRSSQAPICPLAPSDDLMILMNPVSV